jgi:hypothetical protein
LELNRCAGDGQDSASGGITLSDKPPTPEPEAGGVIHDIFGLPSKLMLAAINLPKKLLLTVGKSVLGESNFNLVMKVAGLGPGSFHVLNATEAQLTVQTFNQDDKVKLIPFETYNVAPREGATCRATPGAGQGPKAVGVKLNGDSQVLYVPDGARMKAVAVSPCLPRSPLSPCCSYRSLLGCLLVTLSP